MAYMTANVGASHMRAGYKAPTGLPNRSAVDLMEELVDSQHGIVIRDSMILCAFAKGATPDDVMVQAWKATTGEDCTWDDLMDRARVQWDQARQWNVEHWQRPRQVSRPGGPSVVATSKRTDPQRRGGRHGLLR